MQRGVYGRAESPYNAHYPDRAVRLGLVQRRRHGYRRQFQRLRPGRRNLVQWPRPRLEQWPVPTRPRVG